MLGLITAIIFFISSVTVFALITIDSAEWGKSEIIDKMKIKLDDIREKRNDRYWKRH